jgi:hypothetical protein
MVEELEHAQFGRCLKISSGEAEVIVSLDFGPRVLHYALDGGENIFGWHPQAAVTTELGNWKPYGGHRLWLAPENMPLSYAPDNEPVEYLVENEVAGMFMRPADTAGIEKQFRVTLDERGSGVSVEHKITNRRSEPIEAAIWALTIMRPGGEAVIPNEPFVPYSAETLLPVRSMTLWSYTDLTDPRWSFEKDSIHLRVDENIGSPQKFGILNKQGWAAYRWNDLLFTKRFDFIEDTSYPDMNSNTEVYTAGGFVEVETLSRLEKLAVDRSIEYTETWELSRGTSL